MGSGILKVKVVGDASGLDKTLGGVGSGLKKFGVVAAGAFVAAGAGFLSLMDDAGQMQQGLAKASTVFGESLGGVEQWASKSANAMGLSKNQAVSLAASMGDLLVPMGFTREAAAAMSKDTMGLAGALSAWTGGTRSAAEVGDILTKAMLGEREELKSLGISISEADVKQRLLENGTANLTGAALAQAEAIATQQLIFEKSQDAQTAYGDSQLTIAEKMARVKGVMAEVKDGLLTALMPAYEGLLNWVASNMPTIQSVFETVFAAIGTAINWISDEVVPRVQSVIQFFREWFEGDGGPAISGVWDFIKGAAEGLRAFIVDVVVPKVKDTLQFFRNWWDEHGAAIATVFGAIRDAAGWVIDKIRDHWPEISTAIKAVWSIAEQPLKLFIEVLGEILDAAAWVINKIRDEWPSISGKVQSVWDAVKGPLGWIAEAFNKIAGAIQWALEKLNLYNATPVSSKNVSGLNSGGTGVNFAYPGKIPKFAEGGMVPGSGPQLAIVHGGERVLTPAQQRTYNMGGVNINIIAGPNAEATGDAVVRKLMALGIA